MLCALRVNKCDVKPPLMMDGWRGGGGKCERADSMRGLESKHGWTGAINLNQDIWSRRVWLPCFLEIIHRASDPPHLLPSRSPDETPVPEWRLACDDL